MSELVFTKVCERAAMNKFRIYKLSVPVFKAPNKNFDFSEERKDINRTLKEEYKYLTPNAIEYVAISDAITHSERLMFLAAMMKDGSYTMLPSIHLDGEMSMMVHGGDHCAIQPDEAYLSRLAKVNGFKFMMGDTND